MTFNSLRRRSLLVCGLAVTIGLPSLAHAHAFKLGKLRIDHPYATPSRPGASNGAAYFRGIENRGKQADRLVAASSPVAERVELHEMKMDGDIMRMREIPGIDIPAGEVVQLRHGQPYHLMLMNLKQPLAVGDRFDVTLTFEKAGEITVKAWVQQPRDASDHDHSHDDHDDHKH